MPAPLHTYTFLAFYYMHFMPCHAYTSWTIRDFVDICAQGIKTILPLYGQFP